MTTEQQKKIKNSTKIIFAIVLIGFAIGAYFGIKFYSVYFAPNIRTNESYVYVRTGMGYSGFLHNLLESGILKNEDSFKEAAERMKLPNNLKPGRYAVTKGMNNRTLINKIKAGNQNAVKLKFQNIRKKESFAAYLGRNMEADSMAFIKVLDSAALVEKYGFTTDNVYSMFIPNTYEQYWNVDPVVFFEKMQKQYEKFWTKDRKLKAERLNLTPIQVSILASIIDWEALYDKEMPRIAGLYLNRLNQGILLQSDPTVIFATGDFTIKRVLNSHLAFNSRYNTYKYAGLPPGPIMMPSIKAIDAVLNPEQNKYIYMCAKEDFSGYHAFAETREQHEINANKYRAAMNKRNIYK